MKASFHKTPSQTASGFFCIRLAVLILCALGTGNLLSQSTEAEARVQAQFIEGQRDFLLGNYEKAITKFKEVLQKDPQNSAAAFELARAHENLNKDEEAIRYAKQAVAKDPENVWYRLFLGDLYQKTARDEDAAFLYEEMVKKYPAYEEYYLKWAFFLVRANQPENAVKVYEMLEKRIGINEELTRRKHALFMGMGDVKMATAELEKLISAFPNNMAYRHLLADFFEQIGDATRSKEVYQQILKMRPDDAKAKIALAGELRKNGKETDFLQNLKPIFENAGVGIDLKIKELLPYIQKVADTGDRNLAKAALELSEILERVHPNEAKGYTISGDLYFYTAQPENAAERYRKTLLLDNSVYLVWEQLLLSLMDLSDFETMIKTAEEALDLFPNQAALYYYQGFAMGESGKHTDAVAAFEQAKMMVGRNARLRLDILVRLGWEYSQTGQFDLSVKAFEEAAQLNSRDPGLLSTYSQSLALRGHRLDNAKSMAALANDLVPGQADYQYTYGLVLYKMKDYPAAREWMSKALQNSGDKNPKILEHYGDVLFHLGLVDEAVLHWQRALDKTGKSALLERKIADRQMQE